MVFATGELQRVLYIVIRGAIETTIRRGGRARRVRLAGPAEPSGIWACSGRIPASPRSAHASERCSSKSRGTTSTHCSQAATPHRGFTAAFNEDVVRALVQADRPTPRMVARTERGARPVATVATAVEVSGQAH